MSLKNTIISVGILGGVGAFVYAFYAYANRQAKLLEDFTWKLMGIKFDSYSLQAVKGKVEILFSSESDVEIEIEKFIMTINFNLAEVGYIEDSTPFIIPARGTAPISFNFTLNPQLIFGNVTNIINYALQKEDAAVSLRGFVSIKSGFVKASIPITYDSTIKCILYDKNC
jgi:hypothetical protein